MASGPRSSDEAIGLVRSIHGPPHTKQYVTTCGMQADAFAPSAAPGRRRLPSRDRLTIDRINLRRVAILQMRYL